MALRLIEIFLPQDKTDELLRMLDVFDSATLVQKECSHNLLHTKLLMNAAQTEELLDDLESRFSNIEGFRIIIAPVQATIPRIKDNDQPESKSRKIIKLARVSREELYHNIQEASQLSWLFATMVCLSSIVAAIGLLRNSAAVVIGAMVIAPLLGPNVALALASALGDSQLAKRARRANLAGIIMPLLLSAAIGFWFGCDDLSAEIHSRTQVSLADIVLALAAGCAGTLSFTMALSGTLIGVMVAVALLPPLVTSGILLGCGQWNLALGAGLIFAANLICINLAGVTTFLVQGVRPRKWWDKEDAKTATRKAITIWMISLLILIALILASQKWLQ